MRLSSLVVFSPVCLTEDDVTLSKSTQENLLPQNGKSPNCINFQKPERKKEKENKTSSNLKTKVCVAETPLAHLKKAQTWMEPEDIT